MLAGLGEVADEVQPQGFPGVDFAAGEYQFARDGTAHQVVQRPLDHRAVGGLGMGEGGSAGGDA